MTSISTLPYNTSFQTTNDSDKLSVLSWNVLHKDFAMFLEDYPLATEDMLIWKNRLPKLRGKMHDSNADIVCLQEVSFGSFVDDFGGYFQSKHGYDYRLNQSPLKMKDTDHTTAIMFKSSKFECVHEDHRSRAIILLLTNKLEQSQCVHCRESKRICLYHSFFVVNVHLEAGDRGSARMSALKSIFKRIRFCISEKLKINNVDNRETANMRILIMGDFNSGAHDAPSLMLLNANDDEKKHQYHFEEAYLDKMVEEQYQNEFKSSEPLEVDDANLRLKHYPSFIVGDVAFSIDLLFYTADNVKLHGVSNTMDEELETKIKWKEKCTERINQWMENGKRSIKDEHCDLADYSGIWALPNHEVPSDHLPISALFEFTNLCDVQNRENEQCRCCLELKVKQKMSKKEKRAQKKKKKNQKNGGEGWKFHDMTSF